MNRYRSLVALCLTIGVAGAPAHVRADDATPAAIGKLAQLPEQDLDIASVALAIAQAATPELDAAAYLARVDALARELGERLKPLSAPDAKLEAMGQAIYKNWGFAARDVLPPDAYVGLNEVLDKQQWNCFGMTVLYLALGERVHLPLKMVAGTGHVLVQYAGEPTRYVETTQEGRVYPSKDYLKNYLPFPCLDTDAYVVRTKRQTAAVIASQTALAVQHQGRLDLAEALYTAALGFDPKWAEAQAGLGFVYAARGQDDKALPAFQKAIVLDPKFREAYAGLGGALHDLGKLDEALAAYRKLVELCPDEPKGVFNLAQLLYEKGDLGAAIAAFRRYTTLAPQDPDGFARLAFPLEDKGELDAALAAYQKALQLNPRYKDAYINRGGILEKQAKWDAAMQSYRQALELQADDALALAGTGRVFAATGHLDEALAALHAAAASDPANAAIAIDYGNALQKAGRLNDAIGECQRAVQLTPDDPEAYLALAEVLQAAGRSEEAQAAAEKARALGATPPPDPATPKGATSAPKK